WRDRGRARGLRLPLSLVADHGAQPDRAAVALRVRHLHAPRVARDPGVLRRQPVERARLPRRRRWRGRLLRAPRRLPRRPRPRTSLLLTATAAGAALGGRPPPSDRSARRARSLARAPRLVTALGARWQRRSPRRLVSNGP